MKALGILLLAVALVVGCATGQQAPPETNHPRMGMGFDTGGMNFLGPMPAATCASCTVVLFDTTATPQLRPQRIVFSGRFDQPVTLLYQIKRAGSSTWRTVNGWNSGDPVQGHPAGCTDASPGRGLGDTIAANTDALCDFLVAGYQSRLELVTTTAPTVDEKDVALLLSDRTLGM